MITNDATALETGTNALNEASKGNIGRLGPDGVFQWYATHAISSRPAPCSARWQGFMDAVCNFLGGAVNDLSNFGGGVLKDILGAGKSILNFFGLWNPIDSIVSGAFDDVKDVADDIFDGRTHTCGTDSKLHSRTITMPTSRSAPETWPTTCPPAKAAHKQWSTQCNTTFKNCAAIAACLRGNGLRRFKTSGSGLAQNYRQCGRHVCHRSRA